MSTPTDDLAVLPPEWRDYLPFVTLVARQLLTLAGGAGITWALTVNASQVQMAVSALMIAASVIWSGWQKVRARRAIKIASVAPASAPPPPLPA